MQLGRESISSSITALLELVKNAYDADAAHVRLSFRDFEAGIPRTLVIEDSGNGMSRKDILERWMFIGDSFKSGNNRTPRKGRVVTGEKGLGRLGLDRLSSRTIVQSRSHVEHEVVELDIDWSRYEGAVCSLEQIKHPIYYRSSFESLGKGLLLHSDGVGTRLIIQGLKDSWTVEKRDALRSELSLLISPMGSNNDFSISLSGLNESRPNEVLLLEPSVDVLDSAYWKVTSSISADGVVSMEMYSSRHQQSYVAGPVAWSEAFKGAGSYPECGPVDFVFYFIPRVAVEYVGNEGKVSISRAKIAAFMEANQGIRIYRDGFRVKPYGDPEGEGDWLKLAARRVKNPQGVKQARWNVGPNQIVGAALISRSGNPLLVDQANREGIMEGVALSHLRIFANSVVQWFESNHQAHQKSLTPETYPAPSIDKTAANALRASRLAASKLKSLSAQMDRVFVPGSVVEKKDLDALKELLSAARGDVTESQDRVRKTAEEAKSARLEADRQKDTLGNLASLGILTASFGHETLNSSGNILKATNYFKGTLFPSLESRGVELELPNRWLQVLSSDSARVERFARFALGNVLREKRRRSKFSISKVASYVFESFEEVLSKDRKISVDLNIVNDHSDLIFAYEGDWECIFINLITNSVWAMQKNRPEKRLIRVSVWREEDLWNLRFSDSGFGLESGTEHRIFEPTFTTRRNEKGEPTGTGLGLSLVRSFVVDNSSGTITATAKGELGGAEFFVTVPAG